MSAAIENDWGNADLKSHMTVVKPNIEQVKKHTAR